MKQVLIILIISIMFFVGIFSFFVFLDSGEDLALPSEIPKNFTNSIGMEFALIPAGEFYTNSLIMETRYPPNNYEPDVYRCKFSIPFYMGKYEVTQQQWREIMGENPSSFKNDELPVESVS